MLLSRWFRPLLCKTHIFKKPSILKWEKRVFYDFTPSSSSSRPFWFKTVFPDSAEFLHFGEDLKSLVNSYWGFLRIFKIGLKFCKCNCYLVIFFQFFSIFQILSLLWQMLLLFGNFSIVLNSQILSKLLQNVPYFISCRIVSHVLVSVLL